MAQTKSEIREKLIYQRDRIYPEDEKLAAQYISDQVYGRAQKEPHRSICIYKAKGHEVDLTSAIERFLSDGRVVALPRVSGEDMDFYVIHELSDLVPGSFGLLEPNDSCELHVPTDDIVYVPGVAFSKYNGRIGYGKGYYDRFFSNIKNNTLIGIGYGFQVGIDFMSDELDVRMDEIITDYIHTKRRI